ncbi:MAG: phage holin family protein [Pirellulales bacterium]|nr:phage holin family protein [Pirellulales bacterium]
MPDRSAMPGYSGIPGFGNGMQQLLRQMQADLLASARARWRLLQIELLEARRTLLLAAAFALAAIVLGIVGLALLAAALAKVLEDWTGLDSGPLLAIEGALLLILGATIGWLAWRRFRCELRLFEQSLEELQEDLHWLRQHWEGQQRPGV